MWKWLKALNPFESDSYAPWMREEIAALRDQLDAAEIELADKAFYVREFAAVSAERDALKAAQPQSTPLSDEMIERMAMAAREGFYGSTVSHRDWDECSVKDLWCDAIRAALAAVPVPAGVPSVRDLREIGVHAYLSHDSAKRENAGCMVGPMGAAADAILTALAPYLRDQVGWKLDVTAEELSDILLPVHRQSVTVMQATRTILDLCRSRIRPVYECKECANWKAHAAAIEDSSFDMIKRINLARAALEGE